MNLLELKDLGRLKPNAAPDEWLVRNITLRISTGDRFAITGPSSAGKTVLLRLMALLDEPDAGQVYWQDSPIDDRRVPNFRRECIFLHQRPYFVEGTVRDNLELPFRFETNHDKDYSDEWCVDKLRRIGRTPDLLDRNVQTLSGGESQLIVLLRALQLEPTVLLLDEPTASADDQLTNVIEQLLLSWWSPQKAFVIVSHRAVQVSRLVDHQLVLEQGRIR